MRRLPSDWLINDHIVSEEEKSEFDYLSAKVDYYIAKLVSDKEHIKKCRDLYDGKRDPQEYSYLQENYGIETPMDLRMTPLTKTKIDILIGILLDSTVKYFVTCSDSRSLDAEVEQKRALLAHQVISEYQKYLNGKISKNILEDQVAKIKEDLDEDFISSFVEAAIDLIEFFKRDNATDFTQKFKQFALDVLVTGEGYFRAFNTGVYKDTQLEIVKPENLFFNKNTNEQTIGKSVDAVVHREFMTRRQVLTTFGHLMSDEQKNELFGNSPSLRNTNYILMPKQLEFVYKETDTVRNQFTFNMFEAVEVYHVEWFANNEVKDLSEEEKEELSDVEQVAGGMRRGMGYFNDNSNQFKGVKSRYRQDTYEGYRIGLNLYLGLGKSKNGHRSQEEYWRSSFSYQGLAYNDRNGKPYSLAWALKDIQDLYDITQFHRDNIIANSGVDGSRVNVAAIPRFLGNDPMERLFKFLAMKKQGLELIDPTEDGAELFQHYGDFKNSLNANAIQSLQLVLESLEKQADTLTGVNRFMYGAMEERDAVQNVRVGIKQGSLVTKDLMDLIKKGRMEMLHKLLQLAPKKYKNGKKGSYIIGFRQRLFHALPEDFSYTDYNIQIVDDDEVALKLQKIEALLTEFAKAQLVEPEILLELAVTDNINNIVKIGKKSIKAAREKQQGTQQAQQQLEELGKQLEQMQREVQKKEQQLKGNQDRDYQLKERELQIKEKEVNFKLSLGTEQNQLKEKQIAEDSKTDQQRLALEREQLYLATGSSKEVRNDE